MATEDQGPADQVPADDASGTEYRIDDLARAAGTTTRNVRGYQDRGLLPRPTRRGRIAIYTDAHLRRLKVIGDLLGRGFTIRHISDFLSGIQRGDDLADVLGLNDVVSERWSNPPSTTMSADDLRELLGITKPAELERLAELGLIRAEDSGDYTVIDADSIGAYGRLVRKGLPIAGIIEVQQRLDESMEEAAGIVISAGRQAIIAEHHDGWLPRTDEEQEWAAALLTELRSAGTVSAHNALDRALDRNMSRQLRDYMGVARSAGSSDEDIAVLIRDDESSE